MKLGIILMASGFGKRFGSNKLLISIAGKPMYLHTLEKLARTAENLRGDVEVRIIVVSQYQEILKEAESRNIQPVYNPDSCRGITASIRLGLEYLKEDTEYYGFFVADQPFLKGKTIELFIRQYLDSHKGIGCMSSEGGPGNPVIFARKYLNELLKLKGDKGGKHIVLENLPDTFQYPVEADELADLDTPEEYDRLRHVIGND